MKVSTIIRAAVLVGVCFAYGAGLQLVPEVRGEEPQKEQQAEVTESKARQTGESGESEKQSRLSKGEKLFEQNCVQCHGSNGEGTRAGPQLHSISRKLADDQKESQVRRRITNGSRGMPSFGHFEESQVDALVAYLATLDVEDESNLATEKTGEANASSSDDSSTMCRHGNHRRGQWHKQNRSKRKRDKKGRGHHGKHHHSGGCH